MLCTFKSNKNETCLFQEEVLDGLLVPEIWHVEDDPSAARSCQSMHARESLFGLMYVPDFTRDVKEHD